MCIGHDFLISLCAMSNSWLKALYNSESTRIYHYTSQEVLLSVLRNENLRFSDRFYLNDKTEGVYTLNLMIDKMDEIIPDESTLATKRTELRNKCQSFLESLKEDSFNVYQCSFSMNDDSLPLWNYYTKNNELHGVNIGFDSNELAKSIDNNIPHADGVDTSQLFVLGGPVIYDKEKQVEIIKKYVAEYENLLHRSLPNTPESARKAVHLFDYILDRIVLAGTFFKADCFSYEQEYRLAVYLCNEDGVFVALDGKQVEYISRYDFYLPYTDLSFDLSCIKSITLSPTYNFENMKNNMRAMLKSFQVSDNVEIVQSQIPVRY